MDQDEPNPMVGISLMRYRKYNINTFIGDNSNSSRRLSCLSEKINYEAHLADLELSNTSTSHQVLLEYTTTDAVHKALEEHKVSVASHTVSGEKRCSNQC